MQTQEHLESGELVYSAAADMPPHPAFFRFMGAVAVGIAGRGDAHLSAGLSPPYVPYVGAGYRHYLADSSNLGVQLNLNGLSFWGANTRFAWAKTTRGGTFYGGPQSTLWYYPEMDPQYGALGGGFLGYELAENDAIRYQFELTVTPLEILHQNPDDVWGIGDPEGNLLTPWQLSVGVNFR